MHGAPAIIGYTGIIDCMEKLASVTNGQVESTEGASVEAKSS